jgi:hypothetical protein
LRQLQRVSFPIFGRDFAVTTFTFASVLAFPLLVLFALTSPTAMSGLAVYLPAGATRGKVTDGSDLFANITMVLTAPFELLPPPKSDGLAVAIFLVVGALYFLLLSLVVVGLARLLATALSRGLSIILDTLAWRQIRASVYGNDNLGEFARSAADAPPWLMSQPPLPADLADEIAHVSNVAAAASIPKLRSSVGRLSFAQDTKARADLVADYLGGETLVHTTYFKVPRFNKLLAYAITQADGFGASAKFMADPDYATVARWWTTLQAPISQDRR